MAIDRDIYTTDTEAVTITATSGGASATNIYTCPPNHDATIDFLHISNGTTSTQNVTVQWYHADTNTYHHIINDKAISGKDVYKLDTHKDIAGYNDLLKEMLLKMRSKENND